jgi:muramoyltetrapeptide carboxypeptidase
MTTIAFVAPSGRVLQPDGIDRAASYFTQIGWSVVAPDAVWAQEQRFAGPDEERAGSLNAVVRDPNVDVVMAVRGGYGLTRILDQLAWRAIARSGKLFVGHSDFTAFNLALLAKTGMPSFQGPMVGYDFGREDVSSFTEEAFLGALGSDEIVVNVKAAQQPKVDCRGTLWGGNLALVVNLLGTPYFPDVRGGILFLEDISEHPYRIERMLLQLELAGVLKRQRAVLLGSFTDYQLAPHDNGYDFDAMVAYLRKRLSVPILTGLPFGHVRDKVTLPVGVKAELKSMRGGYRLTASGHPILGR